MKKLFLIMFCLLFTKIATATSFENPKQLHLYLRDNFIYTNDIITKGNREYVQLPEVFEFSKAGDCDDFAVYTWTKLKEMNYYVQPYCLYMEMQGQIVGHAITVFLDDDGTYSIFSNQWIAYTNKTNALDAIKEVYPSWLLIELWNPSHYGQVTKKDFEQDLIFVDARNIEILKLLNKSKSKLIK